MKINLITVNLELTTRCNLRCPYCYRTMFGPIKNIDFDMKMLDNIPIEDIHKCFLCGTVGDSCFYSNLKELIKECYRRNPELHISMHTNGTAHNAEWWKDLASIFEERNHSIVFPIDGLEDTHKLHRIGGSYKKTINNMRAFIEGGGNAYWQFILFKHNEHQLLEAAALSRKMKCQDFIIRKSFLFDDKLEKPTGYLPNLKTRTEYGFSSSEEIKCRIDEGEVSILANGDVMPCCHMIKVHENEFKFKALNLRNKHLNEILEDGYIQKIWSERYKRDFCQKCRAEKGSYKIEDFVLETLRNRKCKQNKLK